MEPSIGYYELVGRTVIDCHGRRLGLVTDLVAERRGDALRITALLIGPPGWLRRIAFRGTTWLGQVQRVDWRLVACLGSHIDLRVAGEDLPLEAD